MTWSLLIFICIKVMTQSFLRLKFTIETQMGVQNMMIMEMIDEKYNYIHGIIFPCRQWSFLITFTYKEKHKLYQSILECVWGCLVCLHTCSTLSLSQKKKKTLPAPVKLSCHVHGCVKFYVRNFRMDSVKLSCPWMSHAPAHHRSKFLSPLTLMILGKPEFLGPNKPQVISSRQLHSSYM